jgi:molybdate transport system substrate-binding protein
MKLMTALLTILLWLPGLVSGRAAELTVFAAASLSDALREIARTYERESGCKLLFHFAASSTLARQIQEGAPADLFFSADEEKMEQLEKAKLIREGTRKSLLSNRLVVVVASDSAVRIQTPQQLGSLRRIAIAEPTSVPAGIYARQYLESAGVWSDLDDSVVPTANVRAALAAVESGNVEAGIVYKTDAAISRKVRIAYEVPAGSGPAISYPVALLKEARQPALAERLWKHLQSDAAIIIFEKHGFIVPGRRRERSPQTEPSGQDARSGGRSEAGVKAREVHNLKP